MDVLEYWEPLNRNFLFGDPADKKCSCRRAKRQQTKTIIWAGAKHRVPVPSNRTMRKRYL
ncbi:MAG: hypothetical protein C0629_14675 [Chromatiales bacterium]|nr:MAG: hypothetical protein C0629_14675 [Chromatiales bacterium]